MVKMTLLSAGILLAAAPSFAEIAYISATETKVLNQATKALLENTGNSVADYNWRVIRETHAGYPFGTSLNNDNSISGYSEQNGGRLFDTFVVAMQSKQSPEMESYAFILEAGNLLNLYLCPGTPQKKTDYKSDKTGFVEVTCSTEDGRAYSTVVADRDLSIDWIWQLSDFQDLNGGMQIVGSRIKYISPTPASTFNDLPWGDGTKKADDGSSMTYLTAKNYPVVLNQWGAYPAFDTLTAEEVSVFFPADRSIPTHELDFRFVFPTLSGITANSLGNTAINAPDITVSDIKDTYSIKIVEERKSGDEILFNSETASLSMSLKDLHLPLSSQGPAGFQNVKVSVKSKLTGAFRTEYVEFGRDFNHPDVTLLPASATVDVDPKDAYWYSDIRIQNTGQVAITDIDLTVVTGIFDFINTGADATVTPELGGNSDGLTAAKANIRFTTPLAPGASIRWPSVDVDGEKGVKFFTATIHYADGTSSTGDLVDVADTDDSNPKLFRLQSVRP